MTKKQDMDPILRIVTAGARVSIKHQRDNDLRYYIEGHLGPKKRLEFRTSLVRETKTEVKFYTGTYNCYV